MFGLQKSLNSKLQKIYINLKLKFINLILILIVKKKKDKS